MGHLQAYSEKIKESGNVYFKAGSYRRALRRYEVTAALFVMSHFCILRRLFDATQLQRSASTSPNIYPRHGVGDWWNAGIIARAHV